MIIRTAIGHNGLCHGHRGDNYILIYLGAACANRNRLRPNFSQRPRTAPKRVPGDDHGDARMRLNGGCFRRASPILPLRSWTARNRKPYGKPFVAAAAVNMNRVNRSAPDLFPATCLVKKSFIRREMRCPAPSAGPRMSGFKPLKRIAFCLHLSPH